jgi:hypothetical protein
VPCTRRSATSRAQPSRWPAMPTSPRAPAGNRAGEIVRPLLLSAPTGEINDHIGGQPSCVLVKLLSLAYDLLVEALDVRRRKP